MKKLNKIITLILSISVMLMGSVNPCSAKEEKIFLPEEATFVYEGVEYPFEIQEDGSGLVVIKANYYCSRWAEVYDIKGQFKCRGTILHRGAYEFDDDLEIAGAKYTSDESSFSDYTSYKGVGNYEGKLTVLLIVNSYTRFFPNQAADVDGDYDCDLKDAQSILKYALKIEKCPIKVDADINKDDVVDLQDVQLALKCALKIEDIENYRLQLG